MLTDNECKLILWYRSLSNVERLALNCWLLTGDTRLIMWLRFRLLCCDTHQFLKVTPPVGIN